MKVFFIRIGSPPIFLYFDLYLYPAYAAHYVYFYSNIRKKYLRISIINLLKFAFI